MTDESANFRTINVPMASTTAQWLLTALRGFGSVASNDTLSDDEHKRILARAVDAALRVNQPTTGTRTPAEDALDKAIDRVAKACLGFSDAAKAGDMPAAANYRGHVNDLNAVLDVAMLAAINARVQVLGRDRTF